MSHFRVASDVLREYEYYQVVHRKSDCSREIINKITQSKVIELCLFPSRTLHIHGKSRNPEAKNLPSIHDKIFEIENIRLQFKT